MLPPGRHGFFVSRYARGLTLIVAKPLTTTSAPPQDTPARAMADMACDSALVRLLANMVLHIQSEVQHVY